MTDRYPELWPAEFDPRRDNKAIPKGDWHFHRHLLQRYGVILGPGEFASIIRDIKHGAALPIMKLSPRRTIYSARIERLRERVYVVSDGRRLSTAWPPNRKLNQLRRGLNVVGEH